MSFDVNLNIKIPEEDHDWLKKLSKTRNKSIAELVRQAISIMREKVEAEESHTISKNDPFLSVIGICEGATGSMTNDEIDRLLY